LPAPIEEGKIMRIRDVLFTAGLTGFYVDDLAAIRAGAKQDGLFYIGQPLTPGFTRIRQPGESISVTFLLDDGQVTTGDCFSVQYAGVGGRDPVLEADKYIPLLESFVTKALIGRNVVSFRDFSVFVDSLESSGQRLHSGIRYGLSQAALDAVARARRVTIAEVVADEYGLQISHRITPIMMQSGDDRYLGADKAIAKRVKVLPHGLFNTVEKIGERGEKLIEYIQWLNQRIQTHGGPDYHPRIHIDVYGTIGDVFKSDVGAMADYLARLGEVAKPFTLLVEQPSFEQSKEEQIRVFSGLKKALARCGSDVTFGVDEHCNTLEDIREFVNCDAAHMLVIKPPDLGALHNSIEAVLYCKQRGFWSGLSGTCNSTDIAGRIVAQVALATGVDQMTGRPGMGGDEALQIPYNEMKRTLALIRRRAG